MCCQATVKQGFICRRHSSNCLAAGAIKAIYSAIDFTKDGINDIAIGRDTGSLEVYGFDQQQQPVLVFQASLEESISTIDGGFFTSPNLQVNPPPLPPPRCPLTSHPDVVTAEGPFMPMSTMNTFIMSTASRHEGKMDLCICKSVAHCLA